MSFHGHHSLVEPNKIYLNINVDIIEDKTYLLRIKLIVVIVILNVMVTIRSLQ